MAPPEQLPGRVPPYGVAIEAAVTPNHIHEAAFNAGLLAEHPHSAFKGLRPLDRPEELIPDGFTIERSHVGSEIRLFLARSEDGIVEMFIEADKRSTGVTIASADRARVAAMVGPLEEFAKVRRKDLVEVTFWHDSGEGPEMFSRDMDFHDWSEVERNYPERTRKALADLTELERPEGAGSLILWHGTPGTGKSTAVGALVRQWQSWTNAHVVVDPERFFAHPEYLMRVLLQAPQSEDLSAGAGDEPWLLVICEDADEFIRADARERSGASLGRLLNATDGLLGKGLGVIILLTTNDNIGGLHDAVTRKGRCLSTVEFQLFSAKEAAAWSGDPSWRSSAAVSLAELYDLRREVRQVATEPRRLRSGTYL
jgi:hypothetical protein